MHKNIANIMWFFVGTATATFAFSSMQKTVNSQRTLGESAGRRINSEDALKQLHELEKGALSPVKSYISLQAGGFFCEQNLSKEPNNCDKDCQSLLQDTRDTARRIPELEEVIKDCEPQH